MQLRRLGIIVVLQGESLICGVDGGTIAKEDGVNLRRIIRRYGTGGNGIRDGR